MKLSWRLFLTLVVATGCANRPKAIPTPDVDPETAAASAIEEFDRDADAQLNQQELAAIPALASVVERYDKNGNDALEADEIAAGIADWAQTGVGARQVPFVVTLNGRPLSGATVKLVPVSFLDGAVKAASAETAVGGAGQLSMEREDMPPNAPNIPLVQPGLYRVEITHPTAKIPARYNTQSTLGIEITSGNPGTEGVKWALESK